MRKIYLLLIAIIFSLSASAQTQVYTSYNWTGLVYTFEAHITDSTLAPLMTYEWYINGDTLNGQTVNYTFSGVGYYDVHLVGTGQGNTYPDLDTIQIYSPCNLTMYRNVTNASTNLSSDGAIDITILNGQAPFFYLWNPTNANTQDLTNIPTGTYQLIIMTADSCIDTSNHYVYYDSLINPCNITLSVNRTNATWNGFNDGAIDLTVNGGNPPYTYSWTHNSINIANTEDITNLYSGQYYVTVMDQDSCTSSMSYNLYDDWQLNNNCNLQSSYSITYPTSIGAQDGAIDITMYNGNAPYNYFWFDGQNNYYTEDLTQLGAGTYSLFVVDIDSCSKVEMFYVYPDSLNAIATYSINIDTCLVQIASASIISYSVQSNNIITVVWEFVEVGTGNTSTITVSYLSNQAFVNGRYQFILSINCNSAKSSVTDIYSDYIDIETAIDEHNTNNLYKIYPNPAKETISISLNSNTIENTNINIYNSLGMIVYKKEIEINSGINTYQVPLYNLQKGVYFITINEKTQSFIKN